MEITGWCSRFPQLYYTPVLNIQGLPSAAEFLRDLAEEKPAAPGTNSNYEVGAYYIIKANTKLEDRGIVGKGRK